MNLIFVRHGQSIWNLENKFTGWVDVELSERGVKEAEEAGKTLLSATFLSRTNSELPVPLNSSNMTSSILLPVSIKAVAMMVNEPPSSMFLAAPKNLFGLCNAFASTPPVKTFPEEGTTVL